MSKTSVFAVSLMLAVPVLSLGLAQHPAAAKTKKPTITGGKLSATKSSGAGTTVQITGVKVTSNGATIKSVTSHTVIITSKAAPTSGTLTAGAGGLWSGSIGIPANSSTKSRAFVDVYVDVDSSAGKVSKRIGRVTEDPATGSGGGSSDSPPPPPPI